MAELIIYSGKLKGRRLILPDHREIVIGRDEDCHMRIASSLVSRKHCIVKAVPEGILVRDLESQNGTYINDVAIDGQFLMQPGDVLRIGAALFQVPTIRPVSPDSGRESLSDDDITNWINEQESTTSSARPDTTIIKGRSALPSAATSPVIDAASVTAVPTSPRLQAPRTVKEQAREIIKRHWEMVGKKQ